MPSKSVLGCVLCCGAVAGFLASAFVPWAPAHADDEETARLYVNCPEASVQPIVDFVAERGGIVHDMDSFKRLFASRRVPLLPPLQSGVDVITAIYESLAAARQEGEVLDVTSLHVRERRFRLTVRMSSYETADALRTALNTNPYLRHRMGEGNRVELGSSSRTKDGHVKQDIAAKLPESVGDVRVPEIVPDVSIRVADVDRIALKTDLRLMQAGPERRDANRSLGVMTISREFVYEATELVRLRAFLKLLAEHPDFTVIDVRFTIDEKESTAERLLVGKSTVRVARYGANPPK